MKVFQIKNKVEGFATIDFGNLDMMAIMKSGDVSSLDGKSFNWDKKLSSAISDCPFFIGAMPIFLTKKLGGVFTGNNVSTATFDVEGDKYTIISALDVVNNGLNMEFSKYRTFRSGKIMDISQYIFISDKLYPPIFTLQEFKMFSFCDESVAKKLASCHFKQIEIVECKNR